MRATNIRLWHAMVTDLAVHLMPTEPSQGDTDA